MEASSPPSLLLSPHSRSHWDPLKKEFNKPATTEIPTKNPNTSDSVRKVKATRLFIIKKSKGAMSSEE